ncbi:MAG: tellurite resistance TerB family protein [Alphaproteobacteria bacterium]
MMETLGESQFYMWRTVFALAHADNVVTDEEIGLMARILDDAPFSEEQLKILKQDVITPKKAKEMFKMISNKKDRMIFFEFAHDMVWSDGKFHAKEQKVMIELYKMHMADTTVDELVGTISLELEEEVKSTNDMEQLGQAFYPRGKSKSFSEIISAFKRYLAKKSQESP